MTWPPAYPRVPHLWPAPTAARDDLVLDEAATRRLLDQPVLVEEKLDGANVMLWLAGGDPQVATRGGPDAMDRGGQLGPLRAWVAERHPQLLALLAEDRVLYAEWLWLRHTVSYAALPDHLIGLDLYTPAGFATPAQRDRALTSAGLVAPPKLLSGSRLTPAEIEDRIGVSAYGSEPAEGVVVRAAQAGEGTRLAKAIRAVFRRRSDDEWRTSRDRNVIRR